MSDYLIKILFSSFPEIHGLRYELPGPDQFLTVVAEPSTILLSLWFPYTDMLWTDPSNLDEIYSNQRLDPEEMVEDGRPVAYVGNMSLKYAG